MPRIRTIKPEFWTDEKMSLLDPCTRLVFLGLVSLADDAGRLVDNVKLLDGALFPSTSDTCRDALTVLVKMGRIIRYKTRSSQSVLQVTHWKKHQRVDNPSKYNLPAPEAQQIVLIDDSLEVALAERDSRETLSRTEPVDLRPTTVDLRSTTRELPPPVVPAVPATTAPIDAQRAVANVDSSIDDELTEPPTDIEIPELARTRSRKAVVALPPIKGKAIAKNVLERFTTVLEEVREGRREHLRADQIETLQADFIITFWAHVFDKPRTLIDEKRRTRVRARLKENAGDVNELLYAVEGAKRDPHLMGKNDRETVYDGISTLFRDREMVERLAGKVKKFRDGEQHKMLTKWKEIVAQESQ